MSFTPAQLAALRRPAIKLRRFVWTESRRFDGTPDPIGFWNDRDTVEIAGRTYYGSGTLIAVSGRTTSQNGTVPSLTLTLSQISDTVALMARGQDLTNARIEYLIGIFDIEGDPNALIGPLVSRFVGRVVAEQIVRPEAGNAGAITITAKGLGHQLTMASAAVRSDAAMRRRDPADTYAQYTGSLKGIDIAFGMAKTKL